MRRETETEALERRDRDETETLEWRYRDETETFEKTPRDRLETETTTLYGRRFLQVKRPNQQWRRKL